MEDKQSSTIPLSTSGEMQWGTPLNLSFGELPLLTPELGLIDNDNIDTSSPSDNVMEESSSSAPASPEAEQMKFEHILDLPPPLYLGTITLNYKTKAILQNISKSKNIMGAYHGTIKPLKFRYPPNIKEQWNDIPVFIPKEFRHCMNQNSVVDPLIPENAFLFSIEFLDIQMPYVPCQHKTSPCNIRDVPLVGITTFNGSCQTAFAQFKTPQNKKRDSWNFKLLTRCPCRPTFSFRIKLSNTKYEFETEGIKISQKEKRTAKRVKPEAEGNETPHAIHAQPVIDVNSFADIISQRVSLDASFTVFQALDNFFSYKRLTNAILDEKDIQNFKAYFGEAPYDADNLMEMYSQKSFVGHMSSTEAKKIFMTGTADKLFIIRYSSTNFEKGFFVFENATSAYRLRRVNNYFQTEGGKVMGSLSQFLENARSKGELTEPFPHCNWILLTQSKYKSELPV